MAYILIVDDDPVLCRMFGRRLQHAGYAIRTAHTGVEALQAIEEELPALLILDVYMPEMSGIELLQILRGNETYQNLKVVLISAASLTDEDNEFRTLADEFLTKPVSTRELLDTASKYLIQEV